MHLLAGERLLAAEQARERLDDRHLGAERVPGLPELDADDATAEHDQPLGNPLGGRGLAVRPRLGLRQARNRGKRSLAAGRQHDGAVGHEGAAVDIDPAVAGEPSMPAHAA